MIISSLPPVTQPLPRLIEHFWDAKFSDWWIFYPLLSVTFFYLFIIYFFACSLLSPHTIRMMSKIMTKTASNLKQTTQKNRVWGCRRCSSESIVLWLLTQQCLTPDTLLSEKPFAHFLKVSSDIPASQAVSLWFKTTSGDLFSKVSDERPSGKQWQV